MKTTPWKSPSLSVGIAFLMTAASLALPWHVRALAQETPRVDISRVPEGGLQPHVVVKGEVVHVLYFKGDPKAGDLFYSRSTNGGTAFGSPLY